MVLVEVVELVMVSEQVIATLDICLVQVEVTLDAVALLELV